MRPGRRRNRRPESFSGSQTARLPDSANRTFGRPLRRALSRAGVRVVLLCAAACAAYWNSLGGEFVFDDTAIVQNNPQIRSLDAESLRRIFGSHYWQPVAGRGGLYRPVTMLSYALNYAAGGLDPWGYHLVNILLHAACACLVYLVLRELFGEERFALWSGLLFALHPIRTEAVAYVSGRAESLAAAFFLAAWWCWLRGKPVGAAASFLLAAWSKESAFTFLAAAPLGDLAGGRRANGKAYAALGAAAAAALAVRYAVLGGLAPLSITPSANPLAAVDTGSRILTATAVLGRYLWLLIWPAALSADYSFNQIAPLHSPADGWFAAGAAGLAAIASSLVWAWRRSKPLFLCGAFFLATFSLTSNFGRPIGTIMAERLLYLPSLGFTCAVAYGLSRWPNRRAAFAAGALLAALYAGRTIVRNADWRDPVALFSRAVEVSPNSALAQANLAQALLYRQGQAQQAARHALEAIRIEPDDPAAYMTLGDAYARLGQAESAARAYARVEQLAPGTPGAQEAARRRAAMQRLPAYR